MTSQCPIDLQARPLTMTCEVSMQASAKEIYQAWTSRFDLWFAEPGLLLMRPEVDVPWFFYNRVDWGRHAHYGRFLELVPDRLVVTTWATEGGTKGAETQVRVELEPQGEGTLLKLTHSGFVDEESRDGHAENWPIGLEELDRILGSKA